jgi:hypothetical protein
MTTEQDEHITDTVHESLMRTLESLGGSYDWAIPQSWWDECYERGFRMNGQVVWLYSEEYKSAVFGRPFPVTLYGMIALGALAQGVGK